MALPPAIQPDGARPLVHGIEVRLTPGVPPSYEIELWRAPDDGSGAPNVGAAAQIQRLGPLPAAGASYVDVLADDGAYRHYRARQIGDGYDAGAYTSWARGKPAYLPPALAGGGLVSVYPINRGIAMTDRLFALMATDSVGATADAAVKESGGKAINKMFAKPGSTDPDTLESVPDGTTYGRPLLSRLSAGKPLIDFGEGIHLNKQLDNIADGATYARLLASKLASGVIKRAGTLDDGKYALQASESDGKTKVSSALNGQGSIPPSAIAMQFMTFSWGGTPSGSMWIVASWPSKTLYRVDGSTVTIPSSTVAAPTPTLSQVAGGALGARTYYVRIAYGLGTGIYAISAEASLAVNANNLLKVTKPASVAGYDRWYVLISTTSNTETLENNGGLLFTNDYTEPTTGRVGTGGAYSATWLNGAMYPAVLLASTAYYSMPYYDITNNLLLFAQDASGNTLIAATDPQASVNQGLDGRVPLSAGAIKTTTGAAGGSGSAPGGGTGAGGGTGIEPF